MLSLELADKLSDSDKQRFLPLPFCGFALICVDNIFFFFFPCDNVGVLDDNPYFFFFSFCTAFAAISVAAAVTMAIAIDTVTSFAVASFIYITVIHHTQKKTS